MRSVDRPSSYTFFRTARVAFPRPAAVAVPPVPRALLGGLRWAEASPSPPSPRRRGTKARATHASSSTCRVFSDLRHASFHATRGSQAGSQLCLLDHVRPLLAREARAGDGSARRRSRTDAKVRVLRVVVPRDACLVQIRTRSISREESGRRRSEGDPRAGTEDRTGTRTGTGGGRGRTNGRRGSRRAVRGDGKEKRHAKKVGFGSQEDAWVDGRRLEFEMDERMQVHEVGDLPHAS